MITEEKRKKAKVLLLNHFGILSQLHSHVLSFSSFGNELDTWLLNENLQKKGKLVLPTIVMKELKLYLVTDIKKQLKKNSFGILEPIPQLCKEISPSSLSLALIPALAFDKNRHRLGYGKGYYDRLFKKMPLCNTWGIGFASQQFPLSFPSEAHDIPVTHLFLVKPVIPAIPLIPHSVVPPKNNGNR